MSRGLKRDCKRRHVNEKGTQRTVCNISKMQSKDTSLLLYALRMKLGRLEPCHNDEHQSNWGLLSYRHVNVTPPWTRVLQFLVILNV